MAASLRASLLALLLVSSLVPIAGLGWLEYRALGAAEAEQERAESVNAALAAALRADAAASRGADPLAAATDGAPAEEVLLVAADGSARSSRGGSGTWPELRALAGDSLSGAAEVDRPGAGERQVAWARAPTADALVVLVRAPAAGAGALSAPFLVLAAFAASSVLIVLAFVMLRVVAPIAALERASRRLARGDVHVRAPVDGPAEVRSVATAFNEMAGMLQRQRAELDRALEERTRALIDSEGDLEALRFTLAHEFREPLRSLRWMADDLLDRPLDRDTREAAQVMRRRIDDVDAVFRDLLRYQDVARRPAPRDRVSLDDVLSEALARAEESAPLDAEGPRLPEVEGNRDLLLVAFTEVLRNAAMHARTSSAPAQVRVRAVRAGEELTIHIDDRGPGISPARREDALNLFQRLRRDVPGTGAGLALARKAVQRHGGDLSLGEAPGGGARVTIRLPLVAPPEPAPAAGERAGRRF